MTAKHMVNKLQRYFHIWWILTSHATQVAFSSKIGAALFIVGKLLRFVFFLFFLILILSRTKEIAGYSLWQIILFFATFNLIDTISQFFLREVYRFRSYVVSGNFDYLLTKPISPLLRSLFGGSDVLDLFTLIAIIGFIIYAAMQIGTITVSSVVLYLLLVMNAFVVAMAFHICVLALGVLTTEVDNAIWIFREMTQLGRIPVEVYRQPMSAVLTFVIPVAVMISFPAKALMGILSVQWVVWSFLFGVIVLFLSYRLWIYALKRYASASS